MEPSEGVAGGSLVVVSLELIVTSSFFLISSGGGGIFMRLSCRVMLQENTQAARSRRSLSAVIGTGQSPVAFQSEAKIPYVKNIFIGSRG